MAYVVSLCDQDEIQTLRSAGYSVETNEQADAELLGEWDDPGLLEAIVFLDGASPIDLLAPPICPYCQRPMERRRYDDGEANPSTARLSSPKSGSGHRTIVYVCLTCEALEKQVRYPPNKAQCAGCGRWFDKEELCYREPAFVDAPLCELCFSLAEREDT